VVSAIYIYPLKSGKAVAVSEIEIGRIGPKGDRRLALYDADSGDIITARVFP
jgi:uncharacterized protein YcbX